MNILMNPCHSDLLVLPARVSNHTPHSGAPIVPSSRTHGHCAECGQSPSSSLWSDFKHMALLVSLVDQILEDILHTDDLIYCQLVKNSSCMMLTLSAIKKRRHLATPAIPAERVGWWCWTQLGQMTSLEIQFWRVRVKHH